MAATKVKRPILWLVAGVLLLGFGCGDDGAEPPVDAALPDVAAPDQQVDFMRADQPLADAALADAALPDAALPDAAVIDAALTDAASDLAADASAPDAGGGDGCVPSCAGKECGSNGCGGSCGSCAYGCSKDLCLRKVVAVSVYVDCTLCGDTWPTAKPDVYLKLNLSSGASLTSAVKKEACGALTFNWTVSSKLEVSELSKGKWEIWDDDPTTADDLCVAWTGSFSKVGTFTLSGKMSSKLTYLVSK